MFGIGTKTEIELGEFMVDTVNRLHPIDCFHPGQQPLMGVSTILPPNIQVAGQVPNPCTKMCKGFYHGDNTICSRETVHDRRSIFLDAALRHPL